MKCSWCKISEVSKSANFDTSRLKQSSDASKIITLFVTRWLQALTISYLIGSFEIMMMSKHMFISILPIEFEPIIAKNETSKRENSAEKRWTKYWTVRNAKSPKLVKAPISTALVYNKKKHFLNKLLVNTHLILHQMVAMGQFWCPLIGSLQSEVINI